LRPIVLILGLNLLSYTDTITTQLYTFQFTRNELSLIVSDMPSLHYSKFLISLSIVSFSLFLLVFLLSGRESSCLFGIDHLSVPPLLFLVVKGLYRAQLRFGSLIVLLLNIIYVFLVHRLLIWHDLTLSFNNSRARIDFSCVCRRECPGVRIASLVIGSFLFSANSISIFSICTWSFNF
jgi:hypothetical protein